MASAQLTQEQSQYLTFQIAGEAYAVGIMQVREIIQYETVTKVPKTPPWIRGVINLRGGVVPVVDLAVKFGLSPTPVKKSTCIVISEVFLGSEQAVIGVLADAVSQVIELGADEIAAPPSFGTAVRADFLLGMGKVGRDLVLMLDIDRVLSFDELLAAGDAASETPAELADRAAAILEAQP